MIYWGVSGGPQLILSDSYTFDRCFFLQFSNGVCRHASPTCTFLSIQIAAVFHFQCFFCSCYSSAVFSSFGCSSSAVFSPFLCWAFLFFLPSSVYSFILLAFLFIRPSTFELFCFVVFFFFAVWLFFFGVFLLCSFRF